ncbi:MULTISPECIES: hypothetical protein [Comamonadaceae]|nr:MULTISPECIES: hypothetical protein [Comamonadaceae]
MNVMVFIAGFDRTAACAAPGDARVRAPAAMTARSQQTLAHP